MKASTLLRLLACTCFLFATCFLRVAYNADNRVWLIGTAAFGAAGVNFLIQASKCGERKLW